MYHTISPGVLADTLRDMHAHWEHRSQERAGSRAGAYGTPHDFTIAVAREAGANGSAIARVIGKHLGWPVYDHELLEMIAKDMGLHASLLENVDEKARNQLREFVKEVAAGFASGPVASEYTFVNHLLETLVALSMLGECVIVGRGAGHLLVPETTLRVRLVGPRRERIAVISRQFKLSLPEAERRLESIEQERRTFIKRHFRADADEPDNYDLLLNVFRLTPDECADIVVEALHHLQARKDTERTPREWQFSGLALVQGHAG